MNNSNKLFLSAVGMFIVCVMFWFSGHKTLANEVMIAPVMLGLSSMLVKGENHDG